jgi:hypothetical protein
VHALVQGRMRHNSYQLYLQWMFRVQFDTAHWRWSNGPEPESPRGFIPIKWQLHDNICSSLQSSHGRRTAILCGWVITPDSVTQIGLDVLLLAASWNLRQLELSNNLQSLCTPLLDKEGASAQLSSHPPFQGLPPGEQDNAEQLHKHIAPDENHSMGASNTTQPWICSRLFIPLHNHIHMTLQSTESTGIASGVGYQLTIWIACRKRLPIDWNSVFSSPFIWMNFTPPKVFLIASHLSFSADWFHAIADSHSRPDRIDRKLDKACAPSPLGDTEMRNLNTRLTLLAATAAALTMSFAAQAASVGPGDDSFYT